jgi:CRP-like cAMP-binding protein
MLARELAVAGGDASFGEMALVEEAARRSATVAALEKGETFAVYQDDFARLRCAMRPRCCDGHGSRP